MSAPGLQELRHGTLAPDRLQVALDALVSVDSDADLQAVPREPDGDPAAGRRTASVTLLLITRPSSFLPLSDENRLRLVSTFSRHRPTWS